MDLGNWLDEVYVVPGESVARGSEGSELAADLREPEDRRADP